ncbi:MAG: hypothetical protein R3301_05640, partial [Saprospiraceae bacterium]|nr:hypothetical protein [Saprospiraceae bacterium]
MKKRLRLNCCIWLGSIMLVATPWQAVGQCLPSGITFTSQAAIDAFPVTYPGCTMITGDVRITGNDITNVDSLRQVEAFLGLLEIDQCSNLLSVDLPNCTMLHRAIISNNELLATIRFEALEQTTNGFLVHDNNQLISVSLPALSTVQGSYYFYENRQLRQLDITGIASVEGDLTVLGNLIDSLHLPALTYVGENLAVLSNDSVRSVVLPLLSEVRGDVSIGFMPILTELDIAGLSTL